MNTANGIYPAHQNHLNPSLDQNGAHAPFGQPFGGPNVNPSNFDFTSQFPNQPGQRFGDNIAHNASPSIQQSPFQVPSVVPQKRTREEHVSASPHPPNNTLGQSRSQTPQQAAFNHYAAQPSGQNFSTPTPFQQHMHASNHATPSPNPSNQQFRPPTSQPSMSSPQNYPGQHPQASPFPQMGNAMNRMGAPPNPGNHFMPGMQPGQGLPTGTHGGMGPGGPQMPGQMPNIRGPMQAQNMNPQQQEMYKRYQDNMMMRQQQMRNMGQMPPGGPANGMNPQQRAAMTTGMNPGMSGQSAMTPGADRQNPQHQAMQFMSQLQSFLQSRNQQLDPNPTVCGQRVHYFQLFQLYVRLKPQQNPQGWQLMLQSLRIPPQHHMQAMQEIRQLYERNLSAFGQHYMQMQERFRQMQQGRMPGQGSPTNEQLSRPPIPPGFHSQNNQHQGPSAGSPAIKSRARGASSVAPDGLDHNTPGKSGSVMGQNESPHQFTHASPVPLKVGPEDESDEKSKVDGIDSSKRDVSLDESRTLFDPEYKPRRYSMNTHGGLPLDHIAETGTLIHEMKTFPRFEELGPVDLHSLTMGLQSGFHEEINYALDRLAILSQRPLYLPECLDLVDGLLELGKEKLQELSSDAEPIIDLQISPMEDLTSPSRDETYEFREDHPFGGDSYDKRHAIDTLLAVTTIFRNLSFAFSERHNTERENEANRKVLTSLDMQSFLARVIRLLHTPASPLATKQDHLDIAKDVVVFLSNVCETLAISNEEDARAFLMFLVAFAPKVRLNAGRRKCSFATYSPSQHQYLPHALDSLAKILARDDPNRGFIKTILHNDFFSTDDAMQCLLTKVFALAIAPIPEKTFNLPAASNATLHLVEKRKPSITQGTLLLDILSTLIPASTSPAEACLQRKWLDSEDGWATRVIHMVMNMSTQDAINPQMERDPVTHEPVSPSHGFQLLSQRGLSMVRRLLEAADKADLEAGKNGTDLISRQLLGKLPLADMIFAAMMQPRFDAEVIRGLTALSQMIS